jgi:hypothetical protein
MMDDLAHTLQSSWRSLYDIQHIAIARKLGRQQGELKPFEFLRVQQIREELHARGSVDTTKRKDDLEATLKSILKGIQRVPTLLLLNPTGDLSDLNLEHYTVLDCEPLHDLKGHLINMCKELPYLLTGDTRKTCEDIISATVSDKMTCADHRKLILNLYLNLRQQQVDKHILNLLETAIRMSYLPAEKRTQRRVLQLYNCTWLHHELCKDLFTHLHAGMTKTRMFGSYLHALVAHAPLQMEITPLRSVNTENQERIFSQARKTATATSNRHAENIISSLVIRLQAKTELKGVHTVVQDSESSVSKASKHILPYKGTIVERSFLNSRLRSWQQHLRRRSPFLEVERVWWKHLPGGYIFHDGDANDESHSEGPKLLHYRSATIKDVTERQSVTWKRLLQQKIELPTPKVYLYDAEGNPAGELIYPVQANSCHHGTRSQGDSFEDNTEESIGDGMGDSTGDDTRESLRDDRGEDRGEGTGESTRENREGTGGESTGENRGEGTGGESRGEDRGESTRDNTREGTGGESTGEDREEGTGRESTGDNPGESIEDEHLGHMLSNNLPEQSENIGDQKLAPENNTKLKLSLDLTNDMDKNTHFKTKHAACVSKVLGTTDKVVEFDTLRFQLKSTKKPSKALRQAHKLLAELQSLIQVHKTSTEQELKQVEAAYFKQHATIPTCNSCPEHAQLMKLINKLLATWNIQL